MFDKSKLHFELVRPIKKHAMQIMKWRNDPTTLQMSFDSRPLVFDTFFPDFLESYFSIPDLPPLFAWVENKPVGFIRFRNEENSDFLFRRSIEISINLAPEERGKGFSVPILEEMSQFAKMQGYDEIIADIKPDNTASHNAFTKAGYQRIGPITIENQEIIRYIITLKSPSTPHVFVIAEAGSNWCITDSLEANKNMALRLIDAAVQAKADAIKFQVFRAETTYVKNAGASDYLSEYGVKTEISSLFKQLEMPYEMIPELAEYCKKKGIAFMASVFSENDFKAVDPYVSMHKIASYEISHPTLLKLAAKSQKPLLLSTGASDEEDIEWAVDKFRKEGGKDLTLLQCTAKYPADLDTLHLRTLPYLRNRFSTPVGFSDHSLDPISAPVAAVALGASVIEKHFTLSKDLPGPDHPFALTPIEFTAMIESIRKTEKALGSSVKKIREDEKELYHFARRGVQAIRNIEIGEIFKEGDNIAILRPGKHALGVHPRFLSEIEGSIATHSIANSSGIQHTDWKKIND